MPWLNVRLTLGQAITHDSILEYFKDIKTYITSEHEDTNHHYNILFETTKSVNAFRNHMNRYFKTRKNYSYCKEDRGRSAIYISKDKNVVRNDLYTDEELKDLFDQSYQKKANTKESISTRIIREFPYDDLDAQNVPDNFIIDHILTQYRGSDSPFDEFVIYRIFNAIYNKVNETKARDHMRTRIRNMSMRNLQN